MKTKHLLIIEDEIIIGMAFSKYLKTKGYNCDIALDYEQAIHCLEKKTYHSALIDIKLKGHKSGLDVASKINEHFNIPFIFITSYMDLETLNKAKLLKPKGYLTKPVNKESLFTTLEMIELNKSEDSNFLIVKDGKDICRIDTNKICFIQSNHIYVSIVLEDGATPYLIRNSLQNILKLIKNKDFIQVHRSYLVNMTKVNKINRTELFINHHRIPIGKTRQKELAKCFTTYTTN